MRGVVQRTRGYVYASDLLNIKGELKDAKCPASPFPSVADFFPGPPFSQRMYSVPRFLVETVRAAMAGAKARTATGSSTLDGYAAADWSLIQKMLRIDAKRGKDSNSTSRATDANGHQQKLAKTITSEALVLDQASHFHALQQITYPLYYVVVPSRTIREDGNKSSFVLSKGDTVRVLQPEVPDPELLDQTGCANATSAALKRSKMRRSMIKLTYKRHHRDTNGTLSVGVSWQNVVYNPTTSEEYVYWL